MGGASGTRDMVHIHVTDGVPIQARALPFADRIEVRFGRAFPVTLVIDGAALKRFTDAVAAGVSDLQAAKDGSRCDDQP
jgi:hypothetical protein